MRRWWIPLFWCAFAFMSATQTFLAMLTHGHSFARIVFYQLAVWAGWIVLTPLVIRLVERFPPRRWRNIAVHAGFALAMAVAHVAYWIALTILIQPYDDMTIREFGPAFPSAHGRADAAGDRDLSRGDGHRPHAMTLERSLTPGAAARAGAADPAALPVQHAQRHQLARARAAERRGRAK